MVDELETAKGVSNSSNAGVESLFNAEQQSKVQGLIDDAYKRAYSKALRGGGVDDEVKRLKGEVEGLKVERKNSLLLKTVARHNVVDPEEVSELIGSHVKFDDNGNLVAGVSDGGSRVTVDEFVQTWLTDRPHHLRSSATRGSGSLGNRGDSIGRGRAKYNLSDPQSWRNMPKEDFDALMKEGVNIGGSGGKNLSFKNISNPFHEARKRKFKGDKI